MAAYPSSLLVDGEEIELQLRPHFRALVFPAFLLLVSLFLLSVTAYYTRDTFIFWPLVIGAGVLFLWGTLIPFLRWLTTQFVFTNRRIITREGLISRDGKDMPLAKVNNVSYHVSLMGRILNYGTLEVESANSDDGDLRIDDVPNVEKVQRLIYHLYEQDDARKRGPGYLPSDT